MVEQFPKPLSISVRFFVYDSYFIEAYAHLGDWSQALKLSRQAYKVSPRFVGPPLCHLWEQIKRDVSIPDTFRDDIHNHLGCFTE